MSERVGSDIKTNLNLNFQSILSQSRNSSFNFRVVVCRIRPFPKFISKIKLLWSGLPLSPCEILWFFDWSNFKQNIFGHFLPFLIKIFWSNFDPNFGGTLIFNCWQINSTAIEKKPYRDFEPRVSIFWCRGRKK